MRFAGLLAVVAAFVALLPAEADARSCAPTMKWQGRLYSGGFFPRGIELGARLGTGIDLCSGAEGEEPARLTVRRIKGVRPAVAVRVREWGGVYLAAGYVIESARHPLHRPIYRSDARPNEALGWSCSGVIRRTGRVVGTPPNVFRVKLARTGAERLFFLDARTEFSGLSRFGVPFLGRGTRVTVEATRCTASHGRRKVVARSVSRVTS